MCLLLLCCRVLQADVAQQNGGENVLQDMAICSPLKITPLQITITDKKAITDKKTTDDR